MFGVGHVGRLGSQGSGGGLPFWLPLAAGLPPTFFADFTTEGTTNRYWYNGLPAANFAAWNTAIGGTYTRGSSATYLSSGVLQTATSGNPRFPKDASGVPVGLRLTGAQTELALWNRDLTNAAWVKTTTTVAKDQVGVDGVAAAASSLTATAGNATVLQSITDASASRIMGAYVKRLVGTGTINITQDNGATWTAISITGTYAFYKLPAATLANPIIGFRIVTNGDAIAVDFVSERTNLAVTGNDVPDVIATTTAPVTQSADSLSFPFAITTFSTFCSVRDHTTEFVRWVGTNVTSAPLFTTSSAVSSYNGAVQLTGPAYSGGASAAHKAMSAGSPGGRSITSDGAAPVSDANAYSAAITTIKIGDGGGAPAYGNFTKFALWSGIVASGADLTRLTT